ncbi:MAG TPA: tRNA (adenosine(37)-N6)-threonylcarbamoyltransferase complex ATPase subunit type 1 TsaE [Phycisphaerales bacterium]|nr:tRNA (adenosine(37)-N6)-threonylcarbamoyltransferase complex ATPase subunit type 1 TsaE [Phycisphaerales bacterium]
MDLDITSNSPEQTIELGRKIGSQLKGGEVVAVCGQLGSGKTHLIKGIAAGAGAKDSKQVNSPTFVIVNEYLGRLDIYHIDAYRLNSVSEFEMIGFDDFCYPQSVVLIEWADKIESALGAIDYIRIELEHAGQTQRDIHIKNAPDYIDN